MEDFSCDYKAACETIRDRIVALIPDHPEILEFTAAEQLHAIPGFDVSDLAPSGAMVQAALDMTPNIVRAFEGVDFLE